MNQFQLLTTRRFLPLFLTQFLGALNDNIFRFALVIFITYTVAERTGTDTRLLIPLSGGIFILPFFLFSSLAGQLADKYEKAHLIQYIKVAEIVIMTLGAIGFWRGDTLMLFVVLFCMGAQSTLFGPLKYGILPQHLNESELTGGNGLIQMGTYTAIILGVVIGGFLAALTANGPIPIVLAVIVVAVCGWFCARAIPAAGASDPTVRINPNIAVATYRLVAYVAKQRELLTLVLAISWFWFVGATFLSTVPTYGKVYLNADEHVVTLLNAAFTIGIAIGAILCDRYSRGRIELGLVPLGCIGISIFALDFYFANGGHDSTLTITLGNFFQHPTTIRAFIDLIGIGACGAVFIIPLYAALQARADETRRSRVIAALNITNALFMVVSALATMLLYQLKVSIPSIFGLVAGLNALAIVLVGIAMPEIYERTRAILIKV